MPVKEFNFNIIPKADKTTADLLKGLKELAGEVSKLRADMKKGTAGRTESQIDWKYVGRVFKEFDNSVSNLGTKLKTVGTQIDKPSPRNQKIPK